MNSSSFIMLMIFLLCLSVNFSVATLLMYTAEQTMAISPENHAIIMASIQSALNFPNSFMIIPLLGGIIVDIIGALNFLVGAEIIFFLGSLLGGCIVLLENQNAENYYYFTIVQIGTFLIGASYQCIRIGLFSYLGNSFISKNSQNITLFAKGLSGYIIMQCIGTLLPHVFFLLGTPMLVLSISWGLNFIAIISVIIMIKKNKQIVTSASVGSIINLNVEMTDSILQTSWIQRNDIIREEETDNLAKFARDITIWGVISILTLAYLQAACDFLPYTQIFINPQNISSDVVGLIYLSAKIIISFILNFIEWTPDKVKIVNFILFINLSILLKLNYNSPDISASILIAFTILNAFQQYMLGINLLYIIKFNMVNVGKSLGLLKWVSATFALMSFALYDWYLTFMLGLIYLLACWKLKSIDNFPKRLSEDTSTIVTTKDIHLS